MSPPWNFGPFCGSSPSRKTEATGWQGREKLRSGKFDMRALPLPSNMGLNLKHTTCGFLYLKKDVQLRWVWLTILSSIYYSLVHNMFTILTPLRESFPMVTLWLFLTQLWKPWPMKIDDNNDVTMNSMVILQFATFNHQRVTTENGDIVTDW